MNISDSNQRKLLDELSVCKVMLPDIKRISIECMNSDSDVLVRDFLDSCVPDSLLSIRLNYSYGSRIKASFYLPSIQKAFKKTT
jgi:hypothetical protein